MKNKIIGIYSLVLGIGIILIWIIILSGSSVPEGKIETSFHLVSEFLMATFCIVSGVLVLRNRYPGRLINMTALGMLIYSVLNAAGYYGETGEIPVMIMFITIAVLSIVILRLHFVTHPPEEK